MELLTELTNNQLAISIPVAIVIIVVGLVFTFGFKRPVEPKFDDQKSAGENRNSNEKIWVTKSMTDIPTDTLEELKCSSCSAYLSRGPVYLQHDEAAVCGRCYTPKHSATRNKQYEATAKLLKFPCKYRELGCPETVPFVDEADVVAHEEVCEHRQYVCPVLGSAHCDWLGTRAAMLEHCRDQHLDSVLENPCSLTHDISKSSLNNYILRAFQLLFLLHAKVCVATGKIYHSVRFLGTSEEAADFFYSLNIKRGNEQLSKEGQVAPQGCLAIQEPTSVALNTNSLLEFLGGFDGTTFTVTVKRRVSDEVDQLASRVERVTRDVVTCAGCGAEVTVLRYREEDGWRCERCAPDIRYCRIPGCVYTDIDTKCYKHERYFCRQRTTCFICKEYVSRGMLLAHCGSVHQGVTCRAGSTWRATQRVARRLLSSVAGTGMFMYILDDIEFDLFVSIPVSSERLREFRCEVQLTHPITGHTQTYTPDVEYDAEWDWSVRINKKEFPFWSNVFYVILNINKID